MKKTRLRIIMFTLILLFFIPSVTVKAEENNSQPLEDCYGILISATGKKEDLISYSVSWNSPTEPVKIVKDDKGNIKELWFEKSESGGVTIVITPNKKSYISPTYQGQLAIKGWDIYSNNDQKTVTIWRNSISGVLLDKIGLGEMITVEILISDMPNEVISISDQQYIYSDSTHIAGAPNQRYDGKDVFLVQHSVIKIKNRSQEPTFFEKLKESLSNFTDLFKILSYCLFAVSLFVSAMAIGVNVVRLSTSSAHPVMRREAWIGLITSFICVSLLGGINLIVSFILQVSFG